MIISFKHNYIFIRPKKVAGSTIEAVLYGSLGEGDVLVKPNRDSLIDRLKANGHLRPDAGGIELRQHMSAKDIASVVTEDFWNKTFKFTASRHPYERLVSMAHYRMEKLESITSWGNKPPADFEDAMRRLLKRRALAENADYLFIDGKLAVDMIIRQEHLLTDLKMVGAKIGVPIPDELPQLKSARRADRRPASEVLTQAQKDAVYEQCQAEFELLGYQR